jgi:HEAT repeat protein
MALGERNTTIRIVVAAGVVVAVLSAFYFLAPAAKSPVQDQVKERQRLIAALRAPMPEDRAKAAARLGRHRPVARETVAALALALEDQDLVVQTNAAAALAEIGPLLTDRPEWAELAVPAAIKGLDDSAKIAIPCEEFLGYTGSAGKPAIPALRRYILFSGQRQRIGAIKALIKLDAEHVEDLLPGLADLFKDVDSHLRGDALATLAKIGGRAKPAAVNVIALIDGDPDPGVRVEAANTLVMISPADGARAVPGLVAVIKEIDEKTGGKLKKPLDPRQMPDPGLSGPAQVRTSALLLLYRLDPKAAENVNQ